MADNPEGPAVIPIFYIEQRPNPARSLEEGRPIYEPVEFVEVIVPGDKNSKPVYKVHDTHRERWADEYAKFKAGENSVEGTPLDKWGLLTPTQVAEMNALGIKTVEHLGRVSDGSLDNLGPGGLGLRASARTFIRNLRESRDAAEFAEKAAKETARADGLEAQLADLQKAHATMAAQIAVLTAAPEDRKALEKMLAAAGEEVKDGRASKKVDEKEPEAEKAPKKEDEPEKTLAEPKEQAKEKAKPAAKGKEKAAK